MENKPGKASNSVHSVHRGISILQVLAGRGAVAVTDFAGDWAFTNKTGWTPGSQVKLARS
ncbi:hypothetical protein QFZ40_002160 [Arthrobacter pascens]|uniref:hypothetical protein n=1 Tax=Arthrobacter pascens TaxID=1677 RepID=UPI00278383B3|nr:hypothetical protein [Arthrobacter pascens]MDQ0634251.1 hypothetical protein [Arthrobacter pascens]